MNRRLAMKSLLTTLFAGGIPAVAQRKPRTVNTATNYRITTPLKYSATPANILAVGNEHVGTGDGTTTIYPLVQQAYEGTLQIFLNGVLQSQPDDYVYSNTTTTAAQIAFNAAPQPGDSIRAYYLRSV